VSARQWLAVAAVFLVVTALVVALAGGRAGSRSSTISRGPGGWLAARRYLEARGAQVTLITEPLARFLARTSHRDSSRGDANRPESKAREGRTTEAYSKYVEGVRPSGTQETGPFPAPQQRACEKSGLKSEQSRHDRHDLQDQRQPQDRTSEQSERRRTLPSRTLTSQPAEARPGGSRAGEDAGGAVLVLVLAFPWQGLPTADLDEAIDFHLGRGGDLVLAYSGDEAGAERVLGLWRGRRARSVPLAPWRWRPFMHREWDLRPAERRDPRGRPVRIWAPRVLPEVGPGAQVLYTSPGGQPVVAVFRYHGGRVLLLPADALANARLGETGNVDLLESLLVNLGPRWAFDEYHHGLVTTDAGDIKLGRAADLLLAHLILLYLLAALALARRQGPAWREPAALAGSAATFLLGLGALHHRLGHHREAAQLLLRRARELDRGLALPPELERQAETAGPRELVEIARQVARRRSGHSATYPGEPR
jgi:hypothetical protein